MRLSGLEPFIYRPNLENPRSTFINIGERCNVAGSMMYKKAIVDGDYDKAHGIALKQARSSVAMSPVEDACCVHACDSPALCPHQAISL